MEEGDRDKVWHDGTLEIWGPESILLQNILANICQNIQPLCEAPYRRFNREAARPCRRGMKLQFFFSSLFFLIAASFLNQAPMPASPFGTIHKGR